MVDPATKCNEESGNYSFPSGFRNVLWREKVALGPCIMQMSCLCGLNSEKKLHSFYFACTLIVAIVVIRHKNTILCHLPWGYLAKAVMFKISQMHKIYSDTFLNTISHS